MHQIVIFMASMMPTEDIVEQMQEHIQAFKTAVLSNNDTEREAAKDKLAMYSLLFTTKLTLEKEGKSPMDAIKDMDGLQDAHDKMNFDKDDKKN